MPRCINCWIAIPITQPYQYNATHMDVEIIVILEEWISRQVNKVDYLCQECINLLILESSNRDEGNKGERQFGHVSVCVCCGISIGRRTGRRSHPLNFGDYEWVHSAKIISPLENEDSLQADDGDEIKVFCPKCNAEISHTAEGIQEDQTKIIIAKVYHYFEQEYEELKKSFDGLELTPLSKFRQRTALATGVSETKVMEILQEEERRNAELREEPSPNESRTRKRPRQTYYSSSEEDSDNNEDGDDELSSVAHEEETLVIKEEPAEEPHESIEEPEIYLGVPESDVSGANDSLADPISLQLKTEPQSEEATTSNDTLVAQRDTNSFKRRKTKRKTESPEPSTSAPRAPNAPPTSNAPSAPPKRQLRLLDDGDIKLEQVEPEEGFS